MANIIEIKNLYKSYKDVKAVQDLSFCVKEGELFAFLGVNGAGKSTTISMICGTLEKDQGKIYINDKDMDKSREEIKKEIGVVFQSSVLDKALSVYDNLKYRASLYNIHGEEFENRLNEVCKMLNLHDILKRSVGKLSGGQIRRVDIARAIIHDPKILFLDEPTTGLDPHTRKNVWDVVSTLRNEHNVTVFLTTHYMEEASDADYVIIIDQGKIVAKGTPLELKNSYTGDFVSIYNIEEEKVKLLNYPYIKTRDGFKIKVKDTSEATLLIKNHSELFEDYEVTKGKMDDVFLNVTGKKLEGGNNNEYSK